MIGSKGMKKERNNNKGMTLVEVLIAMTILTVASLAIFSAFISSATYNKRAKEKQRAMNLAQSIMESCKAYNVDDICRQFNGYDPFKIFSASGSHTQVGVQSVNMATGEFTPTVDNCYSYTMSGVNYDGNVYDVLLELSPDSALISSSGVAKADAFNAYNDAIFIQDKNEMDCVYDAVISDFKQYLKNSEGLTESEADALAPIDVAHFTQKNTVIVTSRNLTVNISESGSVATVSVQTTYNYKVEDYEWTDGVGTVKFYSTSGTNTVVVNESTKPDYLVYDNSATVTQGTKLNNVYIYYFPAYNSDSVESKCNSDSVTINNNCSSVNNIFVLKQNPRGYSTTQLASEETTYKPDLTLAGAHGAHLFHNMNINLGNDAGITAFNEVADLHIKASDTASSDFTNMETRTLVYKAKIHISKSGQEVYVLDGSINSK